jgi:hypothetical protein
MPVFSFRWPGVVPGMTPHSGHRRDAPPRVFGCRSRFLSPAMSAQRSGEPGGLGDLQEPGAVSCFVLGQERLEVRADVG